MKLIILHCTRGITFFGPHGICLRSL